MIYLSGFNKLSDTLWLVSNVHYQPMDEVNGLGMTADELNKTGFLLDAEIPPAISVIGKDSILAIDPTTKILSWYQQDRSLTDQEKLQNLESQNAQILLALVNGGLM